MNKKEIIAQLNECRRVRDEWCREYTKLRDRKMNDAQIKHMVDRFLMWRLPEDFHPDCGIHFDADAAKKIDPRNLRHEPTGTNLFDAQQADAMVRYMVEGLPKV